MSQSNFFYSHAYTMYNSEPGTSDTKDKAGVDGYQTPSQTKSINEMIGETKYWSYGSYSDDLFGV